MRKRNYVATGLVLLGVFAVSSWLLAPHAPKVSAEQSESAWNRSPDFHWQSMDGTTHTLSELHAPVVIIHFWASWCGPCREEFSALLKAAAPLNGKVIFLTLSSDDNKETAQKFIREALERSKIKPPANVLYGFDPDKNITFDIFQTIQYPESIVLDSGYHLRRKFPGPVDWNSRDVQDYLNHPL